MNTRALVKEGRPLFWPWCAVMMTGLVSFIRPLHSVDWIGLLGVVLGIPLLATLPLGNEFQNRTLSLLLSQPVGRGKIWLEKTSMALVAAGSVALLFSLSPLIAETLPDRGQEAYAMALVVAVLASATLWTLIARSTIGGVALSAGSVLVVAALSSAAAGLGTNSLLVMTHFTAIKIMPLIAYAGLMLWLGGRMLVRYQVTGTIAGDDLLTARSNAILGAFSGRACSNPTRPISNLVRKELRLLRPVWMITVLMALAWTCFALLELVRQRTAAKSLSLPIVALGVSSGVIVAILAGCLSLGEEKTSGTYGWHRTLPISAARQWAIKLFVALFVSFICSGLIPVVLLTGGEHFFPSAFSRGPANFRLVWVLGMLLLTLASFWCACAVNGTVTAVAWIVPILAVFLATPAIANWVGGDLAEFLAAKLDLAANFPLAVFISRLDTREMNEIVNWMNPAAPTFRQLIFWVPTLIVGVIQSYRLFSAPVRESAAAAARKLLPLVALGLLCGSFTYGFVRFSNWAASRVFGPISNIHTTVQNVLTDSANREAAQPLQMSFDDLKRHSSFYGPEVPWLRNATITISPDKAHPTTCCGNPRSRFARPLWNYTAVVRLASGTQLTISFEPTQQRPSAPPLWKVRIRWPGEASEETL